MPTPETTAAVEHEDVSIPDACVAPIPASDSPESAWDSKTFCVPKNGEEAQDEAADDVVTAAEPSEEEMEEEAKELGLPSPKSLGAGSDFKPFMATDVPDYLRRFALRRLWRSNPVLANVDGLVDYGEDFTDASTVIENLQTVYQVGKGYLRDIAEGAESEDVVAADNTPPEEADESAEADIAEIEEESGEHADEKASEVTKS